MIIMQVSWNSATRFSLKQQSGLDVPSFDGVLLLYEDIWDYLYLDVANEVLIMHAEESVVVQTWVNVHSYERAEPLFSIIPDKTFRHSTETAVLIYLVWFPFC